MDGTAITLIRSVNATNNGDFQRQTFFFFEKLGIREDIFGEI